MTREEFRRLTEQGAIILDGATGTNLQKAGMPVGVCPEQCSIPEMIGIMNRQTPSL